MAGAIVSFFIVAAFYGFVIWRVKGRCSRFEFIIKTVVIYVSIGVLFGIGMLVFLLFNNVSAFFINYFIALALLYQSIKLTIKRFYDLDMDGWHVLLTMIPLVGLGVKIYLFVKEGEPGLNEYDEAVNYSKLLKPLKDTDQRQVIDICSDRLFFDKDEFAFERYLNNYKITIPDYLQKENIFVKYLTDKYTLKKEGYRKIIEISKDEFLDMVKELKLILVKDSFYILVGEAEVFIRQEDFKYTMIITKDESIRIEGELKLLDGQSEYTEYENLKIYKGIYKNNLLIWIKGVA